MERTLRHRRIGAEAEASRARSTSRTCLAVAAPANSDVVHSAISSKACSGEWEVAEWDPPKVRPQDGDVPVVVFRAEPNRKRNFHCLSKICTAEHCVS